MAKSKTREDKLAQKDYESLGKLISHVVEDGYWDHKRLYRVSFIRGMITGFGGAIGATLLVSLALGLISLFDTVPFIGEIVRAVKNSLQQ